MENAVRRQARTPAFMEALTEGFPTIASLAQQVLEAGSVDRVEGLRALLRQLDVYMQETDRTFDLAGTGNVDILWRNLNGHDTAVFSFTDPFLPREPGCEPMTLTRCRAVLSDQAMRGPEREDGDAGDREARWAVTALRSVLAFKGLCTMLGVESDLDLSGFSLVSFDDVRAIVDRGTERMR